jgi:glycosyltransferase involved in cell wall biosynthesis
LDNENYRILWCKQPERREVLNIKTQKIRKQPAGPETAQSSPIISIVMPTCNTPPEYLKESVESVLKQTFADFELLIIDDGSTDLSGIKKLKEYDDPRIRLITNTHDFIVSLNRGVFEAKGQYIARMDADDVMLPNRLQVQYEYMEEHPEVDVCGSWVELFGDRKEILQLEAEHKQIVATMLLYNPIAHQTVIMRKSVWKNTTELYHRGYPCAEDYQLWTDLAKKGFRFANIPQVLLLFRSSENQVSNTKGVEMKGTSRKIQAEYAEWVMVKIVEKEEKFFDFFEQIIMLSNEKKIDIKQLSNIVYQIYLKSLS